MELKTVLVIILFIFVEKLQDMEQHMIYVFQGMLYAFIINSTISGILDLYEWTNNRNMCWNW